MPTIPSGFGMRSLVSLTDKSSLLVFFRDHGFLAFSRAAMFFFSDFADPIVAAVWDRIDSSSFSASVIYPPISPLFRYAAKEFIFNSYLNFCCFREFRYILITLYDTHTQY
jgi:hypothetical protein